MDRQAYRSIAYCFYVGGGITTVIILLPTRWQARNRQHLIFLLNLPFYTCSTNCCKVGRITLNFTFWPLCVIGVYFILSLDVRNCNFYQKIWKFGIIGRIVCGLLVQSLSIYAISWSFHSFPRDATLARYYLWPCVCPYLIIASRCSVKTSERIELVFSKEASFDISYIALFANSGIYKIK